MGMELAEKLWAHLDEEVHLGHHADGFRPGAPVAGIDSDPELDEPGRKSWEHAIQSDALPDSWLFGAGRVSGNTSDWDDEVAIAGIEAAGLVAKADRGRLTARR